MKKQLVVYGGGSSAHTLIPLLADSGMDVNLFTSKPEKWSKTVKLYHKNPDTNQIIQTYTGRINKISCDVSELIPDADYIVFCMPVHQYKKALHTIAPYICKDKPLTIGTVYGQGGFNWMVDEIIRDYQLPKLSYFAFGLIPWICRVEEYGHIGITYGFKTNNYAAVYPKSEFERINKEFLSAVTADILHTGIVHPSENFLSLTLSVDNQIIHPSRCYGLYMNSINGYWKSKEEVPMFYRDFDDASAKLLQQLDADYSAIRETIRRKHPDKDFRYMLDYLALEHFSYSSQSADIRTSFTQSPTLTAIQTPVVQTSDDNWELDTNGRFFTDDIYYGIAIAKWIAEQIEVAVPTIDSIMRWVQQLRNECLIDGDGKLLVEGADLSAPFKSGLPCYYGLKTVDDIID